MKLGAIRKTTVLFLLIYYLLSFGLISYAAAPSVPSNVTVIAGTTGTYLNGSAKVKWNAVSGSDSYAIKLTRLGTGETITATVAGELTTEITITGLIGGSTYSAQVRTVALTELSPWSSDSLTFQPITAPAAPAKPTAVAGNGSASVSWVRVPDANNGGSAITSYIVKEVNSGISQTVAASSSNFDFTGLTRGSTVAFTVTAVNSASTTGTSSVQSEGITLPNVPNTPAAPTLSAGASSGQLIVAWSAISENGGSAITGYTLTLYKDGVLNSSVDIADPTILSKTYSDLSTGSYTAKLVAKNSIGDSLQSALSTAFALTVTNTNSGGTNFGGGGGGGFIPNANPTASASPSPTPTSSASPTPTPTNSLSPSPLPSPTATATPTPSPQPSVTPSPSSSISSNAQNAKVDSFAILTNVKFVKTKYLWVISKTDSPIRKINATNSLKKEILFPVKTNSQFQFFKIPATMNGKILLKSPTGFVYNLGNFKLKNVGTIKSPIISFRKTGSYQLIVNSGKKSFQLRIRIK